jgi:hypothetical protein
LSAGAAPGKNNEADIEDIELPPDPLATDAAVFWGGGDLADDFFGDAQLPPVSAALPRRLGNFPFWRGGERFLDAIEEIYTQASPYGLDIFSPIPR